MMHKTSRTKHFFVLFSKAYPFIIIFHNGMENILESYLSSYFISRIHLVSCGEYFLKMSLKKGFEGLKTLYHHYVIIIDTLGRRSNTWV